MRNVRCMSKKRTDTLPSPSFSDSDAVVKSEPEAKASKRGMGWIPDPVDARDYSARQFLGAPRERGKLKEARGLAQYVRSVRDQGSTSSCVGQAFATAIDTRFRAIGIKVEEPAAQGIYTYGRGLARKNPDEPLVDDGCIMRLAAKGLKTQGVPGVSVWPFDATTINDEPKLHQHQNASAGRLAGYAKIDSTGEARILDIDNALSKLYPVAFGLKCDDGFQDYDGKSVLGLPVGANYGGHAVTLLEMYTDLKTGAKWYLGINSWGPGWGDRGWFRISEERLKHPTSDNFYMFQQTA